MSEVAKPDLDSPADGNPPPAGSVPAPSPPRGASAELQLGAVGRMRIDSDKCDWRVVTPGGQVRGSDLTVDEIQGTFPAARLRMDSDKCDWRLQVGDPAERVIRAAATGSEFEVRGRNPAMSGELRSSKCDWTVQVTGAWPGMRTPPHLRADLHADKCDFAVQLEVGIRGGPRFRLHGAGSDKCDFRVIDTGAIFPERPTDQPAE